MRIAFLLVLSVEALFAQTVTLKPDIDEAARAAGVLRNEMRNSDSFVLEHVYYWTNTKDKEKYCYEYRAQNGFGGMDRETMYLMLDHKKDGKVKKNFYHYDGILQQRGVCHTNKDWLEITKDVLISQK